MAQAQDFGSTSLAMFMVLFGLMLTSSLDLFSMRLVLVHLFLGLASVYYFNSGILIKV
jgi:hypothetical protein